MSFDVIALTPAAFPSIRVARAAYWAGHIGGTDLDFVGIEQAYSTIEALIRSDLDFCVSRPRLDRELEPLVRMGSRFGWKQIILSGPVCDLRDDIAGIQACGIKAVVQVTCADDAKLAQDYGADALIVKGNESGGLVGEETTFILLQRVIASARIPVFARGGIGLHTAAACLAAGAGGVVLDWQLALCEEQQLPDEITAKLSRMDGSETAILGQDFPLHYRAYARPGEAAYFELKALEERVGAATADGDVSLQSWNEAVESRVTEQKLLAIGQDACFARHFAAEYRTVGAVCNAIAREAARQCRVAARQDVLREHSPLAESHGTRYPIVQGPMTRVSDRADFALAVAEGGALPFLALALMRGPQVAELLEETRAKLGDKPWGVGILGFVPMELREEQLAEVLKYKPPFAVIAGGRPDQAAAFEKAGMHTYLHIPSPELLRNFLEAGARRVIFEGRECGGHVGPRTSFVLWESMIRVILAHLTTTGNRGEDYHVLFAGGVHDALSAAMVAALAAPLGEHRVRFGVLVGTGYLFTREAVASGAIQEGFQSEAIRCSRTILLESGVGHATRCADSPFGRAFAAEKQRLLREGRSRDEIRDALESLNLGRLRIAAKGITRTDQASGAPAYEQVDVDTQRREGMYMIGQVAALRGGICSTQQLHADIASATKILNARLPLTRVSVAERRHSGEQSADIAIVGISCLLPGADNLDQFWRNILNKANAIREIPKERWDADLYFDAHRQARDRIYSRWGGFIGDVAFDPVRYGMPPASIPSVEPLQLLMLEMVRAALQDAGYFDRQFERERTSVILGTGGGVGELGLGYGFRSLLPHYLANCGGTQDEAKQMIDLLSDALPEWTEDSFAGLLLNVAAGRVANRFDFGGTNYIVDAACATSLAALRLAVHELECRSSDMVIAAGADTMQSPFGYLCFSKTQALSPTGQCRTFDETADGIVISEGVVVTVLKRLEDAVRDGDSIYAVIKSVGASSDGRDKGLTAPRPIGQIRALDRAYAKAGFSANTVGLVEAHGTGTVVGDRTELESLTTYLRSSGAATQSCAVGSVKSMIGHTKCTAGFAGLVKAALALHNKVLPPTIGVTKPNSKANLSESPVYLNTEARPWIESSNGHPRRAGVSAFGFGGTNFHAVLEEYRPAEGASGAAPVREWPAELFLWKGESSRHILEPVAALLSVLAAGAQLALCDLAAAVCWERGRQNGAHCLAVVASSLEDLIAKLDSAKTAIEAAQPYRDPRGVYYTPSAHAAEHKMAFLFPGQGSQRINMLLDLAVAFPFVRNVFEQADRFLGNQLHEPLSHFVFPPPPFTDDEKQHLETALKQTNVAQPALGAADMAMYRLLLRLGIEPDLAAGHSYGEFAALCAAGAVSFEDLVRISEARGRFIVEAAHTEPGVMAAIDGGEEAVSDVVSQLEGVCIANLNAPSQTVISGTAAGVDAALKQLSAKGIAGKLIPVACAFHSNLVAGAWPRLRAALDECDVQPPRIPVFSNTTMEPHASNPDTIRERLSEHLAKPVRFAGEIRAMYEAGARIFIEAGPGKVLTGLASQTLAGLPVTCIALDQPGRNGLVALLHGLAQIAVAGLPFTASQLFDGRLAKKLTLSSLVADTRPAPISPTAWMITAGRAVPPENMRKPKRAAAPASLGIQRSLPQPVPEQPRSSLGPVAASQTGSAAPAAHPVANGGHPVANGAEALMRSHRQLMSKFLDTHRNIMMAAMQAPVAMEATAQPVRAPQPAPVVVAAPAPVSAPPPAPEPVAEPEPLVAAVAANGNGYVATAFTKDQIATQILDLVSQRTGYPIEMLNLDVDMEADLGIDSIKRVEIFGALQNASNGAIASNIENLSKLKTLRAIIDFVADIAQNGASAPAPATQATPAARQEPAAFQQRAKAEAPRLLVQVVDAPAIEAHAIKRDGVFVITGDDTGVAPELCSKLANTGAAFQIATEQDLATPDSISAFVDSIRKQHGRIAGLLHLIPLARREETQDFDARLSAELKTLFLLAQKLEPDLRASKGRVLAATRLGATFISGWPGSGAVPGFVKTLAWEWPDVVCRTVGFEPDADAGQIATALFAELGDDSKIVEAGYANGRRTTLTTALAPFEDSAAAGVQLDASSIVLVTGGARGITADVSLELARRFKPVLILVGRSPAPAADEPADIAAITDEKELKRTLIERSRRSGQTPSPAAIERECAEIRHRRSVRSNIAAMRQAGSTVEYHSVDVADSKAFEALIADLYTRFGRIDGVIHGAGVIEDKLIGSKSLDSFERVLRPKVSGALTLARHLQPQSLKFLVFFSSVSARYGNRGQCDYAAANEVLNKLAVQLNANWPGRIVSINWGPWTSEGGMVSAELAARFESSGVRLISPEAGRHAFVDELVRGRKSDAEVIWGGPIPQDVPSRAVYPLIEDPSRVQRSNGTLEVLFNTTPEEHIYLLDHQIDGRPVMPMAMALELMAEVAAANWPGLQLARLRDVQLLHGIIYEENKPVVLRVDAHASSSDAASTRVHLELRSGLGNMVQSHYRGDAELLPNLARPIVQAPLTLVDARPLPRSVQEANDEWLFHGPLFTGITSVEQVGENGIIANLRGSSPRDLFRPARPGAWITDPVLVDSSLQLLILWARTHLDETPLPSRLGCYHYFGAASGEVRCEVEIRHQRGNPILNCDLRFFDQRKRLIAWLENMEVTCSRALNRLALAKAAGGEI